MATCKECVHDNICDIKQRYNHPKYALQHIEKYCDHYKDRSRFVELPCKVGDTVYFDNVHLRYAKVIAIYIDATGGMFDLEIFTNIETVNGYESFICKDYTFEDIGERIFLTREEAEQALKERESK